MTGIYILIAFAALIAALLMLKVNICAEYVKNGGESAESSVYVTFFFGLFKIHLSPDGRKHKTDKDKGILRQTEDGAKSALEKIHSFKNTLSDIAAIYGKSSEYIRRRIVLKETEVFVKFGLGDAAATGTAVGAAWGTLYGILALLGQICTVKNHSFDVVPVYNNVGFCIRVKGIISFRLINIIKVAIKLYISYKIVMKKRK